MRPSFPLSVCEDGHLAHRKLDEPNFFKHGDLKNSNVKIYRLCLLCKAIKSSYIPLINVNHSPAVKDARETGHRLRVVPVLTCHSS